jgi:guanylate kinase
MYGMSDSAIEMGVMGGLSYILDVDRQGSRHCRRCAMSERTVRVLPVPLERVCLLDGRAIKIGTKSV